METEQTTPPAQVLELAALCRRNRERPAAGITKMRQRIYMRAKEIMGWPVISVRKQQDEDGAWRRPEGPALRIQTEWSMAVEFGKQRITQRALEHLSGASEDWRVLVLVHARNVAPWADSAGEASSIAPADLDCLEYVIAAGASPPIVKTREQIKQAWREQLEQEQRDKQRKIEAQKQRRIELKQRVLALIEQAWNNKEPLSEHGRVDKQRSLIHLLSGEATAQETKAAVKQLLEAGEIERAHHRYTGLKGLKHIRQTVWTNPRSLPPF